MDQITAGQGTRTRVWLGAAACADVPPRIRDAFFAFDAEEALINEAKAVCVECPVRSECLQWALESGQDHGVWGGVTAEERRASRRRAVA